jgi:translocation and assembly module TamA
LDVAPAGPRHRVAEVRIAGLDDEEASAVAPLSPAQAGDPVSSASITQGTIAIEDALHGRGHARARVRASLAPNREAESQRVLTYEVARSGVYRLDAVTVAGLGSTREGWAQEVAGLDPGAPLDLASMRAGRRRLFETGLFASVLPEVDYSRPGSASLTYLVVEKPRFELAYGALWESDHGLSAVVDAVDHNAAGRGITLGARALWGELERSGRLYGALPRLLGSQASLQLFVEYEEEEDRDADQTGFLVDQDTFEINLAAAVPLGPRVTSRLYARYLDVTDHIVDTDPLFPVPPFDVTFAWPSAGFQAIFEGRDDPVSTRRGTFASIDLSAADESIGSEFSYARLFARATHHRGFALFDRRLLWAQSARVGLARAFRGQELISLELLFAGGEYSIRGYDEDSIGRGFLEMVDEQALLVLNEELHIPVWRDVLSGVVFVDAGNVWPDWGSFGEDFLTSAGLGLRASTPVGILRLDLAYPFDRRPGDEAVKVYFGLGNVF